VAATEKDAVWPTVTDWLVGFRVIEGAVATGPVVAVDTTPEQPVEKIPSRITNKTKLKTKLKRFMHCLFQESSPARHLLAKHGKSGGRRVLPSACVGTPSRGLINDRWKNCRQTTARKARKWTVSLCPSRAVSLSLTESRCCEEVVERGKRKVIAF